MTTTKAPLPDEMREAVARIVAVCRAELDPLDPDAFPSKFVRDLKTIVTYDKNLRAHIAEQDEKIADLEAKLSDASMDYYNQQQGKEKLGAENKRLRTLLDGANYTYLGSQYVACLKPSDIKSALAQTEGEL